MIIPKSGKDIPLNQNSSGVPNVKDALTSYFQPITFSEVTKAVRNFSVVETKTNVSFMGVWQPSRSQSLEMQTRGQRKWSYFTLHSDLTISLDPDDVITYLGTQYRILSKRDYSLYGYFEYELVNDYTGAGPS